MRVVCIFLALCVSAGAGDTTKLRIEVKDRKDKPVERASVIVTFSEGRSVMKLGKKDMKSWEVRTNQQGVVNLPAIPQGKVLIRVISKTHQTYGETFEIDEPTKTIQVTLNPPQPQYSAH